MSMTMSLMKCIEGIGFLNLFSSKWEEDALVQDLLGAMILKEIRVEGKRINIKLK